uniref:Methyltransferase-like protein 17, mitochondrial n=1 Tax=Phallusia mammillata TaxID=59560 RepID=A0A6F9DKV7_9ASCI|nr:methyltransferase-like protein 17, mitochondrial [Phallusia mammillata]
MLSKQSICNALILRHPLVHVCCTKYLTNFLEKSEKREKWQQWWDGRSANHPGKFNLPSVTLPQRFNNSAQLYLQEKDKAIVEVVQEKLTNLLHSRRTCLSLKKPARIPTSKSKFSKRFDDKERFDVLENFPDFEPHKNGWSTEYNWKQIVYDEYIAAAYLVGRTPAVYAVILRVLSEIKKQCPDYIPQSLLDFGSGSGTSVWAANNLWQNDIKQYVCVDSSTEMNRMALFMFSGGDVNQHLPGLFLREHLPISFQNNYDVVIASYALSEMPTEKDRINMMKLLWSKTNRFLVIVETGNFYGYYVIQEARNLFLNGLEGADPKKAKPWTNFKTAAKVFAPCPHEKPCPKLGSPHGCTFSQTYNLPTYVGKYKKENVAKEKFSYVVFDKSGEDLVRWPRVVQTPSRQVKCQHCHLCTLDGTIKHTGVSTSKHGMDLKKIAKTSKQGDCWPISKHDFAKFCS